MIRQATNSEQMSLIKIKSLSHLTSKYGTDFTQVYMGSGFG